MVCVLATCGGFGDLWRFPDRNSAYMHPLYQYGDALLSRPEDVCDQYNWLEWSRLCNLAGVQWIRMIDLNPVRRREVMKNQAPAILEALTRLAQSVPTDPAEICRRITEDRRRIGTVAKKKANAPAAPASEATSKANGGSNLPPVTRGPKGVSNDAVIHFGTDEKGTSYSAQENNPKKEGSKTRERFAQYVDGMTIKDALDAGITTADLVYDRDHGFISFDESGVTAEGSGSELGQFDNEASAAEAAE